MKLRRQPSQRLKRDVSPQETLTKGLAMKHAPQGGRINTIRPGWVETAAMAGAAASFGQENDASKARVGKVRTHVAPTSVLMVADECRSKLLPRACRLPFAPGDGAVPHCS